jgi:hypothetical protein
MLSLLLVAIGIVDPASPMPRPEVVPSSVVQEIVLVDGTRLVGVVEDVSDEIIVIRRMNGDRQEVSSSHVASAGRATLATPSPAATAPSEQWVEDVGRTRLLIGPTARMLKRGEVYIDDLSVFFPSVQVGLRDRVSIGAGTPLLIPQTDVQPGDVVWITPKVQVYGGQRTQGAVGVMHVIGSGANSGVAYGVVTYGSANTAVTIGAGTLYPTRRGARGVALVAAEHRLSSRVKLLTENYLSSGHTVLTGGVRILGRTRTLDIAWFKFPGVTLYPIPLLRMTFQVGGGDR